MRLTIASKEYLHDRRQAYRTGLAVDRHTLRQEHEAFHVIKWVAALLMAMVLLAVSLPSCAHADERQVVASVIAAEACGEGAQGMELVASTILNRSKAWHKTPYEIVTAKNQYYGYTASNRERLYLSCASTADRLATGILANALPDKTGGAMYFLRPGERLRAWHGQKTITWGRHTFYKGAS